MRAGDRGAQRNATGLILSEELRAFELKRAFAVKAAAFGETNFIVHGVRPGR